MGVYPVRVRVSSSAQKKPSALRRRLLWYVMFSVIFTVIAGVIVVCIVLGDSQHSGLFTRWTFSLMDYRFSPDDNSACYYSEAE